MAGKEMTNLLLDLSCMRFLIRSKADSARYESSDPSSDDPSLDLNDFLKWMDFIASTKAVTGITIVSVDDA